MSDLDLVRGVGAGPGSQKTIVGTVTVNSCLGQSHGGASSTRQGLNNDLIVRALNYHGHLLTNFLKDGGLLGEVDIRNVDCHLFNQVLV
jgi:hypothetical protein